MSSEFAVIEGCPVVPGTSDEAARKKQIEHLNEALNAATFLRNLNHTFRAAENFVSKNAQYFLIQYDPDKQELRVRGTGNPVRLNKYYSIEESAAGSTDTLIVELDKAENLRAAYPNYYLDVRMFTEHLDRVLGIEPPEAPGRTSARRYDPAWWANRRRVK